MPAPPARTELSDTYPNPSNAVLRAGMGKLWDYLIGLLGVTGNAADARSALGAAASGANGDITSLSGLVSINGGPLTGSRNRLINGNFAINQMNLSGTVTLAAGEYGHDGWKAGALGCTYTFTTSGNDVIPTITAGSLMQVVEDVNVEGGVYTLSHAGTAQARVAVNGASTSGSYAATPLATSSATGGQAITVEFSAGTVSKVQLELGTVATAFERRPRSAELSACQRYFYQISADGANNVRNIGIALGYTATRAFGSVHTPPMRTSPTITYSGLTLESGGLVVTPAVTSAIIYGSVKSGGMVQSLDLGVASGLSAGTAYHMSLAGTTGYIRFSARL